MKGGEIKIMGILTWIILGLVAGWLASMITHSTHGLVMDIVLGIVGAFVGGFIMNILGQSGAEGLSFYSIVVATIGAIALIWIGRMFTSRSLNV